MNALMKVQVVNFRTIAICEFEIAENKINLLKGKNGSGKSSCIDALWMALLGKGRNPSANRVIKHGENSASIKIEVYGQERQFYLYREIEQTEQGTNFKKLVVKGTDPHISASDVVELFKVQSIDIIKFMDMDSIQQMDYLNTLIDEEKLHAINTRLEKITQSLHNEQVHKRNFDDAIRNNAVRTPVTVIDVTDIQKKQKELQQQVQAEQTLAGKVRLQQERVSQQVQQIAQRSRALQELVSQKEQILERFKKVEKDYEEELKHIDTLKQEKLEIESQYNILKQEQATIPIAEINEQLQRLDQQLVDRDAQIAQRASYDQYLHDCKQQKLVKDAIDELSQTKKELIQQKGDLFKSVGIDTEIAFIENGGITFDGRILKDMSTGEQIREICKVIHATFEQGQIRLCIIRNANGLDTDSLLALQEMTAKYNLTFLCEWTDNTPDTVSVEVYEQ